LLLPPFADHLVVRLDIETDAAQRHPRDRRDSAGLDFVGFRRFLRRESRGRDLGNAPAGDGVLSRIDDALASQWLFGPMES
jgi:hypothetical protein